MDRRSFLQSTCLGALGVMAGSSLIDLANVKTIRASSRAATGAKFRDVPLMIEDTPDLKPIGGAYHLQIEDMEKDILVAHVSESHYAAVDIKCTHKGCDLNYDKEDKTFTCPCHGSKFDLSGVPQDGPAKRPVTAYQVELTDTEVIIKIPLSGESDTPKSGAPADSSKMMARPDSTKSK